MNKLKSKSKQRTETQNAQRAIKNVWRQVWRRQEAVMSKMLHGEPNYIAVFTEPPKTNEPTYLTVTLTAPKVPKVRPVYVTTTEVPKTKLLKQQSDKNV
jgi:hypothetical protein